MKKKIIMLGIILMSSVSLLLVMFYIKTKDMKYISSNDIQNYENISMKLDGAEITTTQDLSNGYYRIDAENTNCNGTGSVSWSNISHNLKVKVTNGPLKCTIALVTVREDFNIVAMYVNGNPIAGSLPNGNYYLDTSTTKCYNSGGTEVSKTVTYDNKTRKISVLEITEPVYCEVHLNSAYQVEIFTANSLINDGLILFNLILPLAPAGTNGWNNDRGTSSYSNGEVSVLPTGQYGGYVYNTHVQLSNSILGDQIYSRATLKASTSQVYWVYANDALNQGIATVTGNNTWKTTSGIRVVAKNAGLNFNIYFKTQDARTSGWDTYYLKEPMAISLTDTFGSGNEPDKTFMDRMPYFEKIGGYKNSYNAVGSNPTFNITPGRNYNQGTYSSSTYSSVSCTNGQTASVSNNILTISNLTNNTVCTIYYTF